MSDLPFCNLIMKGGITSGVVYPRAVSELSRHFRFRQLGGASAGAIAASLAAAAEYRRSTRDGDRAGFDRLDALPAFLGQNLLRLFEPEPATRPLFAILIALLGREPGWRKGLRAFGAAVRSLPGCALIALVPAAALLAIAFAGQSGGWRAVVASALSVLIALAGMLIALTAGLVLRAGRELPRNGFGLCRAIRGTPSLTGWLADEIDTAAGRDPHGPPLTFGELERAGIELRMPTTSLGHSRPYRLPLETTAFFWRPEELRTYLPARVVEWMEQHARQPDDSEERTFALLPKGLLPLPAVDDLPVVVGARLSLSFPFLLSAIPFYVIDFQEPERRPGLRDNADIKKAPAPGETLQPSRCWMSDGGIGSNFPIHFFDRPLPSWPTFGLDLWPLKPGRTLGATPADNVILPENNAQGAFDRFMPFAEERGFGALASFAAALVNALHAWMDNQQAKVPGFRDRIAHLKLAPDEGGLNLTMPAPVIDALSERGLAAGRKLAARFAERGPAFTGFDNHRWVRMRSLLPLLAQLAAEIRGALEERSRNGEERYLDLLAHCTDEGHSYPLTLRDRDAAEWLFQSLVEIDAGLKQRAVDFRAREPRPPPVFRVTPDV